jgi:hypothetical protein
MKSDRELQIDVLEELRWEPMGATSPEGAVACPPCDRAMGYPCNAATRRSASPVPQIIPCTSNPKIRPLGRRSPPS